MSADGEAFGSCTSAPSVAFGPSLGPPSPPLPPPPPTLWILVPSLTLSVALLVSCFPRRSSVCRGGCLGKQTGERALGEPDGMLRISVCPGLIPVPGKVFLRGAQRGLKLNGGTATQIFASSAWRAFSSSSTIEEEEGLVFGSEQRSPSSRL